MIHPAVRTRQYGGAADDSVLARIAQAVTGEAYSAEKIAYDLSEPGIDRQRDIVVVEDGLSGVIAYSWMLIEKIDGVWHGFLMARTMPGDFSQWASTEILRWAAQRMRAQSDQTREPVVLAERVPEEKGERRAFLEQSGFRTVRYYNIMRLDDISKTSDARAPEGYRYVHGPGAAGAGEYTAMYNDTWIDHYSFFPLTEARYLHDIENDPEYMPALDIVLQHPDGRFIGFSYCRLMGPDQKTGEVMAIGTRRGFRGLGLGRKLLQHSIVSLREVGASRVELTVDTENPTGAQALYTSVGFKVIATNRRLRLEHEDVLRLALPDQP